MVKPLIECLHDEEVGRLLMGEVDAARTSELEQHLANCIDCRQRLEQQVGDDGWWNETESSLRSQHVAPHVAASLRDAEDRPAYATSLGETRLRGSVLDLLGPTDDPNMLGRIGPYEIIGLLGQGGMGAVFKGFDRSLNRFVAIKMLLPHLAPSGAARKRFAREGQAVAAVVDDHVMAIHCVDEWQGVPYLVMTYSRGITLQKRLSDNGPLEVREILRIGMQAAKGLAAAHAQGIVHRDIKPANIFLDQNVERVQLMDFGLARAVDDASLTRTGVLAGTPQYMSPEQARAETVDHRSDLFSLGSVMYAMCTGHAPFRAESSYSVLRLITDKEPRPIREINPDVPDWLCLLISRLMSKSLDSRYANALEVADLLGQCLAHVQQPTSAPLPASLVPHATTGRSVFNLTRTGIMTMLGIVGMTLLGMMLWQTTEPPDISGQWTSDEWGSVVLEAKGPGNYKGTFSGAAEGQPTKGDNGSVGGRSEGEPPYPWEGGVMRAPIVSKGTTGTLQLKWSRVEQRFNGAWGKAANRCGNVSLRLVDKEIRGGFTTDKESQLTTGTPLIGDLLWRRRIVDDSGDSNHSVVGYGVGDLVEGGDGAPQSSVRAETLVELIKTVVNPDSWDDERVSISFEPLKNNGLFINHEPEVHVKIQQLLKSIRKLQTGKQTNAAVAIKEGETSLKSNGTFKFQRAIEERLLVAKIRNAQLKLEREKAFENPDAEKLKELRTTLEAAEAEYKQYQTLSENHGSPEATDSIADLRGATRSVVTVPDGGNVELGGLPQPVLSNVTLAERSATVVGVGGDDLDCVLRIAKSKRNEQLEWTTSVNGHFSATVTATTDRLPSDDGQLIRGIVLTIQDSKKSSTTSIGMSDGDQVPAGAVKFRQVSAMDRADTMVTFADIHCDDGTTIPISILLRSNKQHDQNRDR